MRFKPGDPVEVRSSVFTGAGLAGTGVVAEDRGDVIVVVFSSGIEGTHEIFREFVRLVS